MRCDFLDVARNWPDLKAWEFEWVEVIGELYHLNALRLAEWGQDQSRQWGTFKRHYGSGRVWSDDVHRVANAATVGINHAIG